MSRAETSAPVSPQRLMGTRAPPAGTEDITAASTKSPALSEKMSASACLVPGEVEFMSRYVFLSFSSGAARWAMGAAASALVKFSTTSAAERSSSRLFTSVTPVSSARRRRVLARGVSSPA